MLVILGTLSSGRASALQSVLSDAADGRRFRIGVKKAQAIDEIMTGGPSLESDTYLGMFAEVDDHERGQTDGGDGSGQAADQGA